MCVLNNSELCKKVKETLGIFEFSLNFLMQYACAISEFSRQNIFKFRDERNMHDKTKENRDKENGKEVSEGD